MSATAVALLLAAPTAAWAVVGSGGDRAITAQTRGIERATAAGIAIEPDAAAAIAEAPVGSCYNDPTQAKCPPTRAMKFDGDTTVNDGWTTYGDLAAAAGGAGATAALIDRCRMRVTDESPYKAAGYAQMDAQDICSAVVTRHELYSQIERYYNGRWYLIKTAFKGAIGATPLYQHTTYKCGSSPLRAHKAHATAYANLQGVWYAALQTEYNNLYCGA